jgi:hypothetical protein
VGKGKRVVESSHAPFAEIGRLAPMDRWRSRHEQPGNVALFDKHPRRPRTRCAEPVAVVIGVEIVINVKHVVIDAIDIVEADCRTVDYGWRGRQDDRRRRKRGQRPLDVHGSVRTGRGRRSAAGGPQGDRRRSRQNHRKPCWSCRELHDRASRRRAPSSPARLLVVAAHREVRSRCAWSMGAARWHRAV